MKSINQKRGPTVGNQSNQKGKTEALHAKHRREQVLATMITDALEQRQSDYHSMSYPNSGSVHPNTRPMKV